jgi:hypothetical protein
VLMSQDIEDGSRDDNANSEVSAVGGATIRQLEAYLGYRYALDLAGELLRLGNRRGQAVYADVRREEEWEHAVITVWSGRDGGDLSPRILVSDPALLEVRRFQETEAGSYLDDDVLGNLWPAASSRVFDDDLHLLARWAGVELAEGDDDAWGSRFSRWARLFSASIRSLSLLEPEHPWCLETVYHGGRETYYIRFSPLGGIDLFSIAEAGQVAGIRSPPPECLADDDQELALVGALDQPFGPDHLASFLVDAAHRVGLPRCGKSRPRDAGDFSGRVTPRVQELGRMRGLAEWDRNWQECARFDAMYRRVAADARVLDIAGASLFTAYHSAALMALEEQEASHFSAMDAAFCHGDND